MHYLANDLEECRYYFDRLDSPALGWSFTVNHAHIQPNNIDAFMQGLDMKRCGEVRLADAAARTRSTCGPAKAPSTSPPCSPPSRRADTAGTTCRPSAAWTTC